MRSEGSGVQTSNYLPHSQVPMTSHDQSQDNHVVITALGGIGSFRAARLPGQATRVAEPLRVSVSNNHN